MVTLAMNRNRMMRRSMAMVRLVAYAVVQRGIIGIRGMTLNKDEGMNAILIARGSVEHSSDRAVDYQ